MAVFSESLNRDNIITVFQSMVGSKD
jgi:hypothetical protein